MVTLTVGGNDLNVAGIAAACVSPDAATYAQVAVAAPNARVVVFRTGRPLAVSEIDAVGPNGPGFGPERAITESDMVMRRASCPRRRGRCQPESSLQQQSA